MIKAVFSDVDGTLLSSNQDVPDLTAAALRRLAGKNIPFIMVSARMPNAMIPIQDRLRIREPMACYNGGLILDEERQPIRDIGIEKEQAIALYQRMRADWPGMSASLFSDHIWLTDSLDNRYVRVEMKIVQMTPTVEPPETALARCGTVHKVFSMGDPDRIDDMCAALRQDHPDL